MSALPPLRVKPYQAGHLPLPDGSGFASTLLATASAKSWQGQPIRGSEAKSLPLAGTPAFFGLCATEFLSPDFDVRDFGTAADGYSIPISAVPRWGGALSFLRGSRAVMIEFTTPNDVDAADFPAAVLSSLGTTLQAKGIWCAELSPSNSGTGPGANFLPAASYTEPTFSLSNTYTDDQTGASVPVTEEVQVQQCVVDASRWSGHELLHIVVGSPLISNPDGFGDSILGFRLVIQTAYPQKQEQPPGSGTWVQIGYHHDEQALTSVATAWQAALAATYTGTIFSRAAIKMVNLHPTIPAGLGFDANSAALAISEPLFKGLVSAIGDVQSVNLATDGTGCAQAAPIVEGWIRDFFSL